MKEHFEKNLKQYSESIQESLKDFSKEGKEKAAIEKHHLTSEIAQESHTSKEAELEIYAIQKQKLEKLSKFKKFLEKTRTNDGGFEYGVMHQDMPSLGTVFFESGNFILQTQDGKRQAVELSEIMTDIEWEVSYDFDTSVNIHDIRAYYLEKLKGTLREKLDQQIIISETNNTRTDSMKKDAYRHIEKRMKEGSEQQGVIAEKMVKNFLKKIAFDGEADFEILDADVYQDVEQKIDFVIHRKTVGKNRGIGVLESDTAQDIGIQFTTAVGKAEHKQKQLEKSKRNLGQEIDDIKLVTLPAHQASLLYKTWLQAKKPGGPEKNWSKEVQESIFRGVMDQILSQEEVEGFCQKHFS